MTRYSVLLLSLVACVCACGQEPVARQENPLEAIRKLGRALKNLAR